MAFILDLKGTRIVTDPTPLVANNKRKKIKDDGEDTAAGIPAATGFQMRDVLEGNDDHGGEAKILDKIIRKKKFV
jgi:hypothetical protein